MRAVIRVLALLLAAASIPVHGEATFSERRTVTATAYNSLPGQGAGEDHSLAAWGDQLEPGMKVIAVSRDLLDAGLNYGTPVSIEGLDGIWYVRDKMHRRWRNKIDIYMGEDRGAALRWGKRKVKIRFEPLSQDVRTANR